LLVIPFYLETAEWLGYKDYVSLFLSFVVVD